MKLETFMWTVGGMQPSLTCFGPTLWVRAHEAQREIDAIQAKLDRVMLEHCPDEMTEEQKKNWADAQRAVPDPDDQFLVSEDRT